MWHHKSVLFPRSLSASLLLLSLSLFCALPSALHAQRDVDANRSAADRLNLRILEQKQAVDSQQPDEIIFTSQRLAALALQQLALLPSSSRNPAGNIELLKKSLVLEDADDTRIALANALLSGHQPDEALIQADRVIHSSPSSIEAWQVRLAADKASGDTSAAAKDLKHLQALHPGHPPTAIHTNTTREPQINHLLATAWNDLGTAKARQHNYLEALNDFLEAEQYPPTNPSLLHNIGIAAFQINNFHEAVRALTLYLQSNPTDEASHQKLALAHFYNGNFPTAAQEFEKSKNLPLSDPRTMYAMAYSFAHSGKQPRADEIVKTLSIQELPIDIHSLVCHLYIDTENYDEALRCYQAVLTQDPTQKDAHYHIAEALVHLDRAGDALIALQEEMVLQPDNPEVEYLYAFSLLQLSRKDEAMKHFENVASKHPEHAAAQYQLGRILLEQGKLDAAIQHLELSERSDSSVDYVHYQLQIAYRKLGRTQDADRELLVYKSIKESRRKSIDSSDQRAP